MVALLLIATFLSATYSACAPSAHTEFADPDYDTGEEPDYDAGAGKGLTPVDPWGVRPGPNEELIAPPATHPISSADRQGLEAGIARLQHSDFDGMFAELHANKAVVVQHILNGTRPADSSWNQALRTHFNRDNLGIVQQKSRLSECQVARRTTIANGIINSVGTVIAGVTGIRVASAAQTAGIAEIVRMAEAAELEEQGIEIVRLEHAANFDKVTGVVGIVITSDFTVNLILAAIKQAHRHWWDWAVDAILFASSVASLMQPELLAAHFAVAVSSAVATVLGLMADLKSQRLACASSEKVRSLAVDGRRNCGSNGWGSHAVLVTAPTSGEYRIYPTGTGAIQFGPGRYKWWTQVTRSGGGAEVNVSAANSTTAAGANALAKQAVFWSIPNVKQGEQLRFWFPDPHCGDNGGSVTFDLHRLL
jgi:hypothetical protein